MILIGGIDQPAFGRKEFHRFALRTDDLVLDLLKIAPVCAGPTIVAADIELHERLDIADTNEVGIVGVDDGGGDGVDEFLDQKQLLDVVGQKAEIDAKELRWLANNVSRKIWFSRTSGWTRSKGVMPRPPGSCGRCGEIDEQGKTKAMKRGS